MTEQKSRLGEFEMIDWIVQQSGTSQRFKLAIGDDCSIMEQRAGYDLLTSCDLLIEDVHFKRCWSSYYDLGRKAAAVNISDIAAMAGTPTALYLGIARPRDLSDEDLRQLIRGVIDEAGEQGAVLAGGDSCASTSTLMISVTVQGEIRSDCAIRRSSAQAGDRIYVSGTLGDSALALRALLQETTPDPFLLQRFNRPQPRVKLARQLAETAAVSALLDLSDGLLGDLGHILQATGLGAELNVDRLPLSAAFRQALAADASLLDLALTGGEDYELVFTSPQTGLAADYEVTEIGCLDRNAGLNLHYADGRSYSCQRGGFDHFK